MKKFVKSGAGFTVIELLIVVAILGLLAGVSIANFRVAEKRKRVTLASDSIINAIRLGQNYTQSGKAIPASITLFSGPGGCADQAPLDYQIRFTSSSVYNLYVEDKCNPVSVYLIQQFQLPVNTQISVNGLALNKLTVNVLSIKFTPPFAVTTASGNGGAFASFTTATVTVQSSDGTVSRAVTVDGVSGKIGE